MNDASFYILASAKDGPILYGIAIYSIDDPSFQDEEEPLPGDDVFGFDAEELERMWGIN